MKRRWNWRLYAGFVLTLIAFLSYFTAFAYFPLTRDLPWVNLLLFLAALALLGDGLRRAFGNLAAYRGRIPGSILALLSVAIFGFFLFYIFHLSSQLPASAGTPQLGQQAPDFTLPDTNGNPVTLSSLTQGETESSEGRWVLLVFYRGYW